MKPSKASKATRIKRALFTAAGTFFLAVAAIGIILPILPTTPFLLLAAACYVEGSERMHRWLLTNRLFGSYLRNYREGKGITATNKAFTLTMLWVMILIAVIFMTDVRLYQIIMFAVPIGVSIHLLRIPTYKPQNATKKKK
jgi:uncharacterized protein